MPNFLVTAAKSLWSYLPFTRVNGTTYQAETVDANYPRRPDLTGDHKDILSTYGWKEILNSGRFIYKNFGAVSGAIDDKANHVVGSAWNPQFTGKNKEWGKEAEKWLVNWGQICDVRGRPYNLLLNMWLGSVHVDRDGDFFIFFAKSKKNYPQLQFVEAHRIGNRYNHRNGAIAEGRYKGYQLRNGVVYNQYSRPMAYHFLGDTPAQDHYIPAENLYHVFSPKNFSQGRGVTSLVQGILDWLDVKNFQDNEKIAQRLFSALALIEKNEMGKVDPIKAHFGKTSSTTSNSNATQDVVVQEIKKGMTRVLKIKGQNLEGLKIDRPGQNQMNFKESVMRGAFYSMGWTYEQAFNSKGQGGANVRRDVAKNQKAVDHRQEILQDAWRACVVWGIANAIKLGILEFDKDWYRWEPQLPKRMTVDYGRDSKSELEEVRTGMKSPIQYVRDGGHNEEDHLRDYARWHKLKQQIADEEGVPIQAFGSFDPNPGTPPQEEDKPNNKKEDEEE